MAHPKARLNVLGRELLVTRVTVLGWPVVTAAVAAAPVPLWQRRYRAPIVGFPVWSRHAPNRLVYVSSESGIFQLHSWDLATGERRQITHEPVGLISGQVSADGERVLWHRDTTGDESGTWMVAPFAGGPAER